MIGGGDERAESEGNGGQGYLKRWAREIIYVSGIWSAEISGWQDTGGRGGDLKRSRDNRCGGQRQRKIDGDALGVSLNNSTVQKK